jgi:hypothetical protein
MWLGAAVSAGACFFSPNDYSGASPTTSEPSCKPGSGDEPIEDGCGVFVSRSKGNDSTGRGTKDRPYATLRKAVESAGKRPVYACSEKFEEALVLTQPATIQGGLDCLSDWRRVGPEKKTTTWTAAADAVPLSVAASVSVTLRDMAVDAADAMAAGSSSIAIVADQGARLYLSRCDVRAGKGAGGAPGKVKPGTGMPGVDGKPGGVACTAPMLFGGAGVQSICGDETSDGGSGGIGSREVGGDGESGTPPVIANGGSGETALKKCSVGEAGEDGAAGVAGAGAIGVGTLDRAGFRGAPGSDGEAGKIGQGGGGGGGARGGASACSNKKNYAGASGGSGGAGGCGGAGGKGGGAGGASIGIVAIGASLSFDAVTITTKSGGKGGDGGPGQQGGSGGIGGTGGEAPIAASAVHKGCSGGHGGAGGQGGPGGGGLGGHSIGIAFTGAAPDTAGVSFKLGMAGLGGAGEGAHGNGAAGLAMNVRPFD